MARDIVKFARKLISQNGAMAVTIGQLMYKSQSKSSRFILREGYNSIVNEVNKELTFLCSFFPVLRFWSHVDLTDTKCLDFISDNGTRLNSKGMIKYFRSMRGGGIMHLKKFSEF